MTRVTKNVANAKKNPRIEKKTAPAQGTKLRSVSSTVVTWPRRRARHIRTSNAATHWIVLNVWEARAPAGPRGLPESSSRLLRRTSSRPPRPAPKAARLTKTAVVKSICQQWHGSTRHERCGPLREWPGNCPVAGGSSHADSGASVGSCFAFGSRRLSRASSAAARLARLNPAWKLPGQGAGRPGRLSELARIGRSC